MDRGQNNQKKSQISYKTDIRIPWLHLGSIASIFTVILIWTVLSEFHIVRDLYLPSPSSVYKRFLEARVDLAHDFLLTFVRMIIGFSIGCTLGIIVSLLMGWSIVVNAITEPIIQIFKPIPPLVLAPFAILWWGTNFKGVLFLVVWGCFFVMVVDGVESIKNVPKIYKWAAAALGETNIGLYRRVVLPCIAPSIVGGLRVAAVIAFNLTTLAEFNIASGGLGHIIIRGYRFLRPDILFLGILCVIVLALVVDFSLTLCSRLLLRWVE